MKSKGSTQASRCPLRHGAAQAMTEDDAYQKWLALWRREARVHLSAMSKRATNAGTSCKSLTTDHPTGYARALITIGEEYRAAMQFFPEDTP